MNVTMICLYYTVMSMWGREREQDKEASFYKPTLIIRNFFKVLSSMLKLKLTTYSLVHFSPISLLTFRIYMSSLNTFCHKFSLQAY